MKLRLSILCLILGGIVSWGLYSRLPARIDGSSVEAMEKSLETIQDSLPEHERPAFSKDLEGALIAIGMEHPRLLTKVMLAQLKPEAAAQAKAQLMEKLSKRVDGMTVDEFRAFAGEGRKRQQGAFESTDSGDTKRPIREPDASPPPLIKPMWASEKALLGAVPKQELETHEIEYRYHTFLVDLPKGTTIKDGYMPKIVLPSGELAELTSRPFNTDQLRIFNGRLARSDPQDTIVFSNSTIHIEKRNPEKELSSERPFTAKMNVVLGPYRCFGVEFECGGYPKGLKLEPLVQLIAGLKTARLKTPDPKEPIAMLKLLDIDYEPAEAADSSEVRLLKFPTDSTFATLRIVENFPDVETLILTSGEMSFMFMDEARPLRNCKDLKHLEYSPCATGLSIDSILQHPKLVKLDVNMGSNDISEESFKQLGNLKQLEHLTLEVDGTKSRWIDVLAECSSLRSLSLKLQDQRFFRQPNPGPSGSDSTISSLAFLARLPEFTELRLDGNFDQSAVDSVGELVQLEYLEMSVDELTGGSLQRLRDNKSLKTLRLTAPRIKLDQVDLAAFKEMPLELLSISRPLGGDGSIKIAIRDLAGIPSLKVLGLRHNELTVQPGDLAALSDLALDEIAIHSKTLSDALVIELLDSETLTGVALAGDQITVKTIESITKLPNLENLWIGGGAIKHDEVWEADKKHPEVDIQWWWDPL